MKKVKAEPKKEDEEIAESPELKEGDSVKNLYLGVDYKIYGMGEKEYISDFWVEELIVSFWSKDDPK